ncbi:metal ABC transporter substrate-binding protein [Actinoplanes sp. NPDC051346]|uniref:metal ABC transporter substrate-binding protein n=1 Tax=Actinoplanes sp. NPDC051346 TaxID=3155048 RepID=UPI0034355F31
MEEGQRALISSLERKEPARFRRIVAVTVTALLLGATNACGFDPKGFRDGRLFVVTALYPLTFLTERVGGDTVLVSQLAKPGVNPHNAEVTPVQIADIRDSSLVVYLDGFLQPAAEVDLSSWATTSLDVTASVDPLPAEEPTTGEEGGTNPHVWLDPKRYAAIAEAIAESLSLADPRHAAAYKERARSLHAELDALDREYAAKLKTCQRREFVTSHSAFGYLADRHSLKEIGITGVLAEEEPSPQRLAEVTEQAKATGTTTVFFTDPFWTGAAKTVASEVGGGTALLDPLEISQPGADYFSVMRANLVALTAALGCGPAARPRG